MHLRGAGKTGIELTAGLAPDEICERYRNAY
jgi:hypothetical protein